MRAIVAGTVAVGLALAGFFLLPHQPGPARNRPGFPALGSHSTPQRPPAGVGGARPDNPDAALRWRRLTWQDEHGQIPADALQRARGQREENLAYWAAARASGAAAGARGLSPSLWTACGPVNVGGRTRAILVDPRDPNRLLGGAVSGGVWQSTDAGATWSVVNDWLPNLAICCLARDPRNPDVLYAGTGEGFFNGDAIGGVGIYKSIDSGATWAVLPSTASWDNVCRIAISPSDSRVLLAGKRYGGIQRSTDGGQTWANVRWAQGSFFVAFDPRDGNKAVAHIIDYDWGVGNWFHAALYSTNAGATWTAAAGLSQVWDFGSRIELAYAPSNPNIVYAACAANGGLIWRSEDGGQTYALRSVTGNTGCNWYANPLWVDPTNPDFLLNGGVRIYKSVDGGVSVTPISNGYILTADAHPDIHCFVADPGYNGTTNRRVYVGTDGGIHRANDIYTATYGSGWESLQSTYVATQFYGAAGDGPTGRLYGGTQDNGTLRLYQSSNVATLPFGGDGGFCAIDPTDANYCYGEYVTLQVHRSTNGGWSAGYIYSGIADAGTNANFIAPFVLDENNPNRMFAGGASLWRSDNVKAATPSWLAVRPAGSDLISAIAVTPGNSDRVWVAQNDGRIYRSENATAATPMWLTVDDNGATNPLPNRYVTRMLVDPDHAQLVYVALGGFAPDNLWKTTDGGATWARVTGTAPTALPSAPVRGVARHPQRPAWLYAGTEVGVYESLDGGNTWAATNRGPANVSVDELVFMHHANTLLAATHGRGLYTADIPPFVRGDLNCDGVVDFGDINPFVLALTDLNGWQTAYLGCPVENADVNGDGRVDFNDINPFVALLSQ